MIWTLLIGAAWPCAGLFHDEDALAESSGQEAILELGEGSVSASYLVEYDGDAEAFGWVIPIFGEFSELSDGEVDRFDSLRRSSAPQVSTLFPEPRCSCLGASKGGGRGNADGADTAGFGVVAEGFTGTYSYTVIEGTSADAIADWLDTNGWSIAMQRGAIEAYVGEGGVQFAAISLTNPDGTTPPQGRHLPPVVLEYGGDSLRYPSTFARYGTVGQVRTTIYVVADERVTVSGWSSEARESISGGEGEQADDVWESTLLDVGGDTARFVYTWSGASEDRWMTRFDTIAEKGVHTVDASFELAGDTDEQRTFIDLVAGDTGRGAVLVLWPLVLVGGAAARRRRESQDRRA